MNYSNVLLKIHNLTSFAAEGDLVHIEIYHIIESTRY